MEGSHGGSSSPAPFLTKTYDMLEEPSTNSIVSWSQSGCSFIVWNPLDFARDLLPTYFKHNNFSSFIRQLNTYGFHKIDPERWEFANNEFIRGQKHLLKKIHRRKPIHSHAIPPQGTNLSMQLSEPERQELKEEIERLKYDKSALIIELEKHAQQQHGIHQKMQDLEDRLQGMMLNQRNLVSFLDQIVQRPGFLSSLIQPSDLQTKKRRLPKHDLFLQDAILQDGSIPALDIEPFEKMESCLNSLEMFFHEVSQASGEDTFPVIVPTNLHDASGETDLDSSCHEYCQSYHGLPDSPTQAESTILPEVDIGSIQTCNGSEVSDLDMNSEPAVHSKGLGMEMPVVTMPIGVNDTFWEQFLTESPAYCDLQESHSERRDGDGRSAERVVAGQGSGWWNRKSVDHLTERMGHLTSTEST